MEKRFFVVGENFGDGYIGSGFDFGIRIKERYFKFGGNSVFYGCFVSVYYVDYYYCFFEFYVVFIVLLVIFMLKIG